MKNYLKKLTILSMLLISAGYVQQKNVNYATFAMEDNQTTTEKQDSSNLQEIKLKFLEFKKLIESELIRYDEKKIKIESEEANPYFKIKITSESKDITQLQFVNENLDSQIKQRIKFYIELGLIHACSEIKSLKHHIENRIKNFEEELKNCKEKTETIEARLKQLVKDIKRDMNSLIRIFCRKITTKLNNYLSSYHGVSKGSCENDKASSCENDEESSCEDGEEASCKNEEDEDDVRNSKNGKELLMLTEYNSNAPDACNYKTSENKEEFSGYVFENVAKPSKEFPGYVKDFELDPKQAYINKTLKDKNTKKH